MQNANAPKYSRVAMALHWITAVLVLFAFIYGLSGPEEHVYSAEKDFERQLHETLGMAVLLISVFRIIWMRFEVPPQTSTHHDWMHRASKIMQVCLYILLFAVPLTAIVGAWLQAHPVELLGGLTIHPMLSESRDLGKQIAELHTWLGDAIIWLAGLHALAALYHHYFLKDLTLRSQLPW